MNIISQMLNSFFVLLALLLTCVSLLTAWLLESGVLTDCIKLLEAQHRGEQLVYESRQAVQRVCIKGKIAEMLRDGELRLVEAAAYFRLLHKDPKSWHDPLHPRPDFQDGESWCREVIRWTERYLCAESSSSQASALRRRLEAELQEQLEGHGTVKLPEK